jgi:CubicO group peptidase (beta-lactamase class C family)
VRSKRRWLKIGLGVLLLAGIVLGVFLVRIALPILNGHTAKVLASAIFVAERSEDSVIAEDVAQYIDYLNWELDREKKSATVSFFGLGSRSAVFNSGTGVTLLPRGAGSVNFDAKIPPVTSPVVSKGTPWPQGDGPFSDVLPAAARATLDEAVDWPFQEPNPEALRRTRAVIVVQGGKLIAERYATGFDRSTPLLGWSMSKSVTAALVGVLVKEGKLDPQAPAPVAEWREAGDSRDAITLDMLLRMSDGLDFDEDYGDPLGDVLQMLYLSDDFAAYTASRPLAFPPDSHWNYSSGTANLVSRIVFEAVGGNQADFGRFFKEDFLSPVGIQSMIMEPDAAGTPVGSSYTYATARDWARFGLLYLQDGIWNDVRILPEGWVKYNATPTATAPQGRYGAHWWLNAGTPGNPDDRQMPSIPSDIFYASGHEGQFVIVVPSRDAVIVRLGLTTVGQFPLEEFTRRILEALPE